MAAARTRCSSNRRCALPPSRNQGIVVQKPCIVANEEHRFTVVEQLRDVGLEPARVLLEPFGRNTAPALAAGGAGGGARRRRRRRPDPRRDARRSRHCPRRRLHGRDSRRRAHGRHRRHRRPRHPAGAARHRLRLHPRRRGRPGRRMRPGRSPLSSRSPTSPPRKATSPTAATTGTAASSCCARASGSTRCAVSAPTSPTASEAAFRAATTDGAFLRFDTEAFAAIPSDSIDYAVMEPASQRRLGHPDPHGAARRRLERPRRLGCRLAGRRPRRRRQRRARRRAPAQVAQHARARHQPAGRRDRRRRRHRRRDRRRGAGGASVEERRGQGPRRLAGRDRPQRGQHASPRAPALGLVREHRPGAALPGQAHPRQAGRAPQPADAPPPRRALDRRLRHRRGDQRRHR